MRRTIGLMGWVGLLALVLSGCVGGGGGGPGPTQQTYTVAGSIVDVDGNGVAGVTVGITGGAVGTAATDANGGWRFAGAKGTVTATPTHTSYVFTPASRTVSAANNKVDFTALGEVDVRFVSVKAERWAPFGREHFVEYVVENRGRAGQYKIEVYGQPSGFDPPFEHFDDTDLLTIGAYGEPHGTHDLKFQFTSSTSYWKLRLNILVWTGSQWIKTDTAEVDVPYV